MKNSWDFIHICDLQPGSSRSFRFDPRMMENWQTALTQLSELNADLLLVGGDLTRDGSLHDFEFEVIRSELESLPYPYYAIPGNMDTGNKHAGVDGATGRWDIQLSMTSNQLDRFSHFFSPFPWSFVHKEVRFSGCYAAVAGSGLLHEEQLWQWLTDLASQPRAKFHVFVMHYALFLDQLDEPNWDLTRQDQYTAWYFSIDQPYRNRIFKALKAAKGQSGVEWTHSLPPSSPNRRRDSILQGCRHCHATVERSMDRW